MQSDSGQLDWDRTPFSQGQYDDQHQDRQDDLDNQRRYAAASLLAHQQDQYEQQPQGVLQFEGAPEFLIEHIDPNVQVFQHPTHHPGLQNQPLSAFSYQPQLESNSGTLVNPDNTYYGRPTQFGNNFQMPLPIGIESVVDGSMHYPQVFHPEVYQRKFLHGDVDQQDESSDDDPLAHRHRRTQTIPQFDQFKFEDQNLDFNVSGGGNGPGHVRSYTVPMGFGMHQYPGLVGQQQAQNFFPNIPMNEGQILLNAPTGQYGMYGEPDASDVISSSPESFNQNLTPDSYRLMANPSPFADGINALQGFQGQRLDDVKRRPGSNNRSNGVRRTQSVKNQVKHRAPSPAGMIPSASYDSLRFLADSRSMSPNPIVAGLPSMRNNYDNQDTQSNQTSPPGSPLSPHPGLSTSASLSNIFAMRQGMGVYSLIDPPLPTAGSGLSSNSGMAAAATLARSSSLSSLPNAGDQLNASANGSGNLLYRCPWPGCDKVFNRQYNLRSHERTHTRERPFTCDVCEATFSRNHDLKRHRRIHTGAKPYVCEQCGKGFARLDAKVRHLKLVGHGSQLGSSSSADLQDLPLSLVHGIMPDHTDYNGYPVMVTNLP